MTSETIGRYILDHTIGQGGMGLVYRAFDPVIERSVAVKTIRLDTIQSASDRATFKAVLFKEARIAGRLYHPGIVMLLDIGEHEDIPFIVMELVEGRPLSDLIHGRDPLSLQEIWRILERLCEAVDYAHGHGVIHSDIKPANVMITELGDPKILDFGIAHLMDSEKSRESQYQGTPKYSAPEQITGGAIDHRTDLFALGILAHKLLSGEDIYRGENIKDILFQIVYDAPQIQPPLEHLGIHRHRYTEIIAKALARDPADRYQKAANLANDLEQVFRNRGLPASRKTKASPKTASDTQEDTQTLPVQTPGLQTQRDRMQQKIKRLNKLRTAFDNAAAELNLLSCRDLIRRLEREDEDVTAEKQRLVTIEAQLEAREKAQLEQTISLKRREFSETLAAGNFQDAAALLSRLRDMNASTKAEADMLKTRLENQSKERDSHIQATRTLFQNALVEENLVKARTHLKDLKQLGVNTESANLAYKNLAARLKKKTHTHLNQINRIRKRFDEAVKRTDPVAAQRMIDELSHFNVSVDRETRILAELELDQHQVLTELEDSFNHALKNKAVEEAESDFAKLRRMLLKRDPERLNEHRLKLEKLTAKQRKKKIREWQKEFQTALDKGLEDQAHRAQQALAELGDDSAKYQNLLARARGREEAAPAQTSWPLIVAIGLVVAALTTWLLIR